MLVVAHPLQPGSALVCRSWNKGGNATKFLQSCFSQMGKMAPQDTSFLGSLKGQMQRVVLFWPSVLVLTMTQHYLESFRKGHAHLLPLLKTPAKFVKHLQGPVADSQV